MHDLNGLMKWALVCASAVYFSFPVGAFAECLDPPGDLNGNGVSDVVDVQCSILTALNVLNNGPASPMPPCLNGALSTADLDCGNGVNVADVLLTIQYSLGVNLSIAIDADLNGCPDLCEEDPGPDPEIEGPFPAGEDHLSRYVWVPSDAALPQGLVIRVTYPEDLDAARFLDSLPVVIDVVGGSGLSSFPLPVNPLTADIPGVVHIRPSFPGEGSASWVSGGTFDQRGQHCIDAMADVVRFALGDHTLSDGRTLEDVVGMPIDTDAVGLIGRSNGGNMATITLATHPDLEDTCFLATWESPLFDELLDIGRSENDPDLQVDADGNGIPWDDMLNPGFTLYTCNLEVGCPVDYSLLAFDGDWIFRDGNGDGVLGDGLGDVDLNGNGQLDDDEDFFYLYQSGQGGKLIFSTGVLDAVVDQGLFADGWPSNVGTPEEADAHWILRSGELYFESLANANPDLHVMVLGSQMDHVQAAKDHGHLWLAYEGFKEGLDWVRMNPDASYLAAETGIPVNTIPEHVVNATIPKPALHDLLVPGLPSPLSSSLQTTGIFELLDRCHLQVWDDDLESVLAPE